MATGVRSNAHCTFEFAAPLRPSIHLRTAKALLQWLSSIWGSHLPEVSSARYWPLGARSSRSILSATALFSNEARGIMVDPTVPVVPDSVTILQDQVSWARMPLWTLADTAVFRVLASHSFLLADTRAVTEHHQFPRHLAEGCTPSGDCWL